MAAKSPQPKLADERVPATPVAYLLHLMQMRLPADIVDPRELKLISLLKATELIEAEVYTAGSSRPRYWETRAATVTRITENGLAELARMSLDLLRSARRAVGKPISPLEYLSLIENSPFPIRVEGSAAITNIMVLKAAGLIDATITPAAPGHADTVRQALIIRITALGRDELDRQK